LGLHFFEFFCDLLWILQGAAKTHKRGKIHFANRPLERIRGSQIYPWFAQTTLERTPAMQCSPRAKGGGADGQIPATSPVVLAGEAAGEGLGSTCP
jgi:hypothetical protein